MFLPMFALKNNNQNAPVLKNIKWKFDYTHNLAKYNNNYILIL